MRIASICEEMGITGGIQHRVAKQSRAESCIHPFSSLVDWPLQPIQANKKTPRGPDEAENKTGKAALVLQEMNKKNEIGGEM